MAKLQVMWEVIQGKQLSGQWPTIEQVQEILISWNTLSDLCFNLLKLHRINGYRGRKGDHWLFFCHDLAKIVWAHDVIAVYKELKECSRTVLLTSEVVTSPGNLPKMPAIWSSIPEVLNQKFWGRVQQHFFFFFLLIEA